MTVSIHSFLTFIDKIHSRDPNYVWYYIDFNDIDWERLVRNSENLELDIENGLTEGGKSLL